MTADERDGDAHYSFECPVCTTTICRPAAPDVADMLVEAGASWRVMRTSPELREPYPVAPPWTHDDLLAFHELLETPDWFDRLRDGTA